MKFFIPAANDHTRAEDVYHKIAKFAQAPITQKRIWQLQWLDNGMNVKCEVGKPLPSLFPTGKELVLAIFECETLYKICTLTHGAVKGEPVLVAKNPQLSATYFSNNS
ncbi:hypothetical protein [Nodularia sphaerocarpa]|uniref:hypothetical protein n=1 Tax=Nodularia sphaerocarpa TaxID=137816 RepID=UPI001EFAE9F0|nr:hypothetical protein [Nodularia sphaerocarpa]MDB9375150.1 hypothetical protein [Nodularia sphaerocarpa CS-585]MDB9378862.1 hypothetical protein [Nodularia sphaerocarpa CS-585A2]ULP73534.1 hypothetical protein BDGGKGIB_03188 [Nodularia sphaerocarpa UHCC 0038]